MAMIMTYVSRPSMHCDPQNTTLVLSLSLCVSPATWRIIARGPVDSPASPLTISDGCRSYCLPRALLRNMGQSKNGVFPVILYSAMLEFLPRLDYQLSARFNQVILSRLEDLYPGSMIAEVDRRELGRWNWRSDSRVLDACISPPQASSTIFTLCPSIILLST